MRLTVVGCSGSYPGPRSAASCYLLEAYGARILLDLGNGALGPLQQYTDLDNITAVLLSHLHPDHCADICGFYVYRRYHPEGRRPPGPVYGPQGVADQVAAMYGREGQPGLGKQFDFVEWKPGTVSVGPFTVTVARVAHPVETYAMRVESAGRVLTYSGDTGPCAALTRLAEDTDVLLSEAAFHDGTPNPPAMHLTGREAGECAEQAGARRLIVTHIPPWNDPQRSLAEATSAYNGPIDLAQPGFSIDV
jgi:ribonuclease BN (tRNA processing enzyme)